MKELHAHERRAIIMNAQVNGGWTREQLAAWGVPFPPHVGWRENLILYGTPEKPEPLAFGDDPSHDGPSKTGGQDVP